MEIKKLEKYLIKKEKTDILTSLKKVNKKFIDKEMERLDADSIEELAKAIVEEFKQILNFSKSDIFTQMFFQRLVSNENSTVFSAYEEDVKSFYVFAYDNGEYYSYYIPDEIREVIKKELGF